MNFICVRVSHAECLLERNDEKWDAVINVDSIATIELVEFPERGFPCVTLKDGRVLVILEDYDDLCHRIGIDPDENGQDDSDDDDGNDGDGDDTPPDEPPAVSREEFVGMWGVK